MLIRVILLAAAGYLCVCLSVCVCECVCVGGGCGKHWPVDVKTPANIVNNKTASY